MDKTVGNNKDDCFPFKGNVTERDLLGQRVLPNPTDIPDIGIPMPTLRVTDAESVMGSVFSSWMESGETTREVILPIEDIKNTIDTAQPEIDYTINSARSKNVLEAVANLNLTPNAVKGLQRLLSTWACGSHWKEVVGIIPSLAKAIEDKKPLAFFLFCSKGSPAISSGNSPDLMEAVLLARLAKMDCGELVILDESTAELSGGQRFFEAVGISTYGHGNYINKLIHLASNLGLPIPAFKEFVRDERKFNLEMEKLSNLNNNVSIAEHGLISEKVSALRRSKVGQPLEVAIQFEAAMNSRDFVKMGIDNYNYVSVTKKIGRLNIGMPTYLLPLHGEAFVYYDTNMHGYSMEPIPQYLLGEKKSLIAQMGLEVVKVTDQHGRFLANTLVERDVDEEGVKNAVLEALRASVLRKADKRICITPSKAASDDDAHKTAETDILTFLLENRVRVPATIMLRVNEK